MEIDELIEGYPYSKEEIIGGILSFFEETKKENRESHESHFSEKLKLLDKIIVQYLFLSHSLNGGKKPAKFHFKKQSLIADIINLSVSSASQLMLNPYSIAWIILTVSILSGCHLVKTDNKQKIVSSTFENSDSTLLINDLLHLSSATMEGRETGTPGNQLARNYIIKQFDSLGLRTQLQSFSLRQNSSIKGYNVIGTITGSQQPDKHIVISAHYDHLGTKNGSVYYGADDNASGSACLLAMARYFKQHPPRHSLLFVAFDAEEKGLQGSLYFVDHPPVSLTSILLNLNMDMISRNDDTNRIYATGAYHYPFIKKYIDSVKKQTSVNVSFGHDNPAEAMSQDWTNQSDHYAFHLKKIPFLYFGVEDHPDYHKPSDTFDRINKQFYYNVCKMIIETVKLLDK